MHKHDRTEARTVESKKQEPCRQHSTMSLMEISKSIAQNLDYSERNKILPKNGTQKSGNNQKMIPKNPGIAHKGTQKSGSNHQKVPKIMAHPRITTYVSYPPPPLEILT